MVQPVLKTLLDTLLLVAVQLREALKNGNHVFHRKPMQLIEC